MRLEAILAAVVVLSFSVPAAAQPAAPERHVRGVITAVAEDGVTMETGPGRTERLKLAPGVKVAQVEAADPAALAQGAYVGTTAVPQPDGTLRALEVHVFAESMRGAGEGHRPWDLAPKSSMTNAAVSGVKAGPAGKSSMTNATVKSLDAAGGKRTITLQYAGGSQTVIVPPKIPIVRIEPGDRSLLVPGAHAIAFATPEPDGSLVAQRLTVGKGGLVPPM